MKKGIVILLFGTLLGGFCSYFYFVPDLQKELQSSNKQLEVIQKTLEQEQKKPPKVQTETVTKTEIQYVPKTTETIIYRDAATGEEKAVQELEKTDVELSVKPPSVTVKYNGQEYEMAGITGETAKFEQGKLVGEVSTTAMLDVTDMVNREVSRRLAEKEKHISIGAYATNQGLVGSIGFIGDGGNREIKVLGTVPDFKKFYGAGVEVKF